MFDTRVVNGNVIDGTGSPAYRADLGITGEEITAVGDLSDAEAVATIDATGRTVCPGFVDAHSHSDTYLLLEPASPSKVFQGITTEIVGNCGASAAPLVGSYNMPSDWRQMQYPGEWSSVSEYRELLAAAGPAVNVRLLVGHNAVRAGIMGYENRMPRADELSDMCDLLDRALGEGGAGLSTGLIYAPGMFSGAPELEKLADVVSRHDGIITSHMRSEGSSLHAAIDEIIGLGETSGAKIEISHLKAAGKGNWGLIDGAFERIENAREKGIRVCADRYPYTSGCTDLDVVLPDWAQEGGREAVLARLGDPATTRRLIDDLAASRDREDWSHVIVGSTTHPDNKQFRGVKLTDVADELGMEPAETIVELVRRDELHTSAFFSGMSEENMIAVLGRPYVMLGTDASLRSPTGVLSHDCPHPRAYGSFPKFIRLVLDNDLMPLEEAVRKMTSLAADHFGLSDRGVLAEGRKADVVIFDPDQVRDVSCYADPHRLSEGIEHLIVNGVHTIANRKLTGKRGGVFV